MLNQVVSKTLTRPARQPVSLAARSQVITCRGTDQRQLRWPVARKIAITSARTPRRRPRSPEHACAGRRARPASGAGPKSCRMSAVARVRPEQPTTHVSIDVRQNWRIIIGGRCFPCRSIPAGAWQPGTSSVETTKSTGTGAFSSAKGLSYPRSGASARPTSSSRCARNAKAATCPSTRHLEAVHSIADLVRSIYATVP